MGLPSPSPWPIFSKEQGTGAPQYVEKNYTHVWGPCNHEAAITDNAFKFSPQKERSVPFQELLIFLMLRKPWRCYRISFNGGP